MKLRLRQVGLAAVLVLAACSVGFERGSGQEQKTPPKPLIWPNEQSKANSDDWLHIHHEQISQMQPHLLVLNFCNGLTQPKAEAEIAALMIAMRQSSIYHGYEQEDSLPAIDYQLFKYVDLSDKEPLPDDQVLDGNSSLYPRVPNWKEGINFRYGELFSDKFAQLYGVADPDHPEKMLNLKELVDRGMVHEVWFLARQGKYGAPYECTEVKQMYDASFNKLPGKFCQAGNGGSDEQPFIGRSLRILFMNVERGPGCAMESLGHGVEGTSNSNAIPYFTKYFSDFAGFNLKKRFSTPFNSLYELHGSKLDYPMPDQIKYTWNGKSAKYYNYSTVGGNVHFAPNAREEYDLLNTEPVLSTIEHYALHDGPDEKDVKEPWTISKIAKFKTVAPDCQGPWMVYWRQNFPGFGAACIDDHGKPMKSWWPFLFY